MIHPATANDARCKYIDLGTHLSKYKARVKAQNVLYLLKFTASASVFVLWIMLLHLQRNLTTIQRCLFITLQFYERTRAHANFSLSPIHVYAERVLFTRKSNT